MGYDAPDLQMLVKGEAQRPISFIRFNPTKVRTLGESYPVVPLRIA